MTLQGRRYAGQTAESGTYFDFNGHRIRMWEGDILPRCAICYDRSWTRTNPYPPTGLGLWRHRLMRWHTWEFSRCIECGDPHP